MAFADSSPGRGRFGFAWSPDGKEIAWIRNFPGSYQELVVHDLRTGRERQITHDRKNIDEVHWTPRNQIVFSSSRGGNVNLWVVRASGGPPTQLTRGSGPDIGMRVSADGRRMIYLEQQQTARLWISPTLTANPVLVTHDELRLGMPAISPDGRKVAVPILRDQLGTRGQLCLMNRDGTGRKPLTTEDWSVQWPRWSPEGRLAFSGRAPSDPTDSTFIYVLDPRGAGRPQRITSGFNPVWLDSTNLGVIRGSRSWIVSADGTHETPAGVDSTYVIPASHRRYALVWDGRRGRAPSWVRTPGTGPESLATYRMFGARETGLTVSSRGVDFLLLFQRPERAERVSLPDLRRTPIPGVFTGFAPGGSDGSLRWDGKEIVYTEPQLSSKLVLIDNLR